MSGLISWTYSGVDFDLPGTGGSECTNYLPNVQKIAETLIVAIIILIQMQLSFPRLSLRSYNENGFGDNCPSEKRKTNTSKGSFKSFFLIALCITFGVEIGYKLASRQLIWALNPCHIVTIIQIYLLAAGSGKWVGIMFRIQIHLLSGVVIALCFPVVNTRLLPHEVVIYWVQHLSLLIIPLYLMSLGDPYTIEHYFDFSWALFVLGLQMAYHFFFLQAVSMMTGVNLNNILCPAVTDPFNGPFYRMWAILHQSALILVHGKVYVFLASTLGIPVTFSRPITYRKSQIK